MVETEVFLHKTTIETEAKVKKRKFDIGGLIRRGIKTAEIDDEGHLIFGLTDGSSVDLGKITGDNGVGIASITQTQKNSDDSGENEIKVVLDNGAEHTFTYLNGSKGDPGFSPIINMEETDEGYTGKIVDAEGEKPFVLKHGVGRDGITPQLRINASTNEWEVSTDKGVTWASTGVKATGKNGESVVITEVEESDEPGGENVVTFSNDQILVIKNGENGLPGGPGFSPTVDIKEIENAYRITITDKDHGPQSFDVPNYKSAPSEAVLYTEQKLTEEQQGRARGNISAAPVPLIVTIKDGYASHTPAEMYAHMETGGTVYLHDESYGLFNTSYGDSSYWYFYYVTAYGGDGIYVCECEIHSDKMAFFYEADISSEEATDGVTPHIGANGNWYIGETDTGVKAQGQNGHTPVKGKDYNTEADKQELVDMVLDALPMAEEASF